MIEKIDLEALNPVPGIKKKISSKEQPTNQSPDIALSSQIREAVNTLVAEGPETQEMDRVKSIKSLIESNQYKIDADALARKLYRSLFSKNMEM